MRILVQAGSLHETGVHPSGIAHFTEHLSGRQGKPIEAALKTIERWHGSANVETFWTSTHFYAVVPSQHTDKAFAFLADLVCCPEPTLQEFKRQKRTIRNELADLSLDQPRQQFYRTMRAAFGEVAATRPIIGDAQSIDSMTLEDVSRFRAEFYTSGRTIVSFEGNITQKEACALVEKYIWLPSGLRGQIQSPEYTGGYNATPHQDIAGTSIELLFGAGTSSTPKDAAALHTLAQLLTSGQDSYLNHALRTKRNLLYNASSSRASLIQTEMLSIDLIFPPENTAKILPATRDILWNLAENGGTSRLQEYQRRVEHKYRDNVVQPRDAHQSMSRKTNVLAEELLLTGNIRHMDSDINALLNLTPSDISAVTQKILQSRPTVIVDGALNHMPPYEEICHMFQHKLRQPAKVLTRPNRLAVRNG